MSGRIAELEETLELVVEVLRAALRAAEELGRDDLAAACLDALGALRATRKEVMRDS